MEIYNNFGNKIEFDQLTPSQQHFLLLNKKNMINKANIRINLILDRIRNDVNKNDFGKKYQIKSKKEYYTIREQIKNFDLKNHKLKMYMFEEVKTNKTVRMTELYDYSLTYKSEYKKVPVILCYFSVCNKNI